MDHFAAIVAFYYLCDQAATQTVLPPDQYFLCAENYQALKLEFIDAPPARRGTKEWAEQNRLGYLRFKAWEKANPDVVADHRSEARTHLGF